MKNWNDVYKMVKAGELDQKLEQTGCHETDEARKRTIAVLEAFKKTFGTEEEHPVALCSAPGRTEISGNHTDHQHGHVLAAAVNLDFLACAALNGTNTVRFQSDDNCVIDRYVTTGGRKRNDSVIGTWCFCTDGKSRISGERM